MTHVKSRANGTLPELSQRPVANRLVGIGSSAGGLEALRELLAKLPDDEHYAFLVAQHLSPHHTSLLTELLGRALDHLQVVEAENGQRPRAGTIYVTPPGYDLAVRNGQLALTEPSDPIGPKPSVDHLFLSLADECGEDAIAVILSGTGSDGAHGTRAIKSHGGITFAQNPASARYDGMPNAAIQSGRVDLILSPSDIGQHISRLAEGAARPPKESPPPEGDLSRVLDIVSARFGVEFHDYKESTIGRQLSRRMTTLDIDSTERYLDFLSTDHDEVEKLYQSFLISVTAFFRDSDYWSALKSALKKRIAGLPRRQPIRAWVAGCATGEEAYTLAILLHDLVEQEGQSRQIKIFATDLDERALAFARQGLYPESRVETIEQKARERYFERQGRYCKVVKHLRDRIVFAHHNLIEDPAFFNLDVITCRNVFIYLRNERQQHLLQVFHHALADDGLLMTGQAESVEDSSTYHAVELPRGLYQRIGGRHLPRLPTAPYQTSPAASPGLRHRNKPPVTDFARDLLFDTYAPMSVLIDRHFQCLHFFGGIESLLSVRGGAADFSLFSLAPPDLRAPLRALVTRASRDRETRSLTTKRYTEHSSENLRCTVRTLDNSIEHRDLLLLSFDVLDTPTHPENHPPSKDNQSTQSDYQLLEAELADTRENLQTLIEQMETSNEELQALNEEMQANSEELQSSNEELQTTNEELHSSNEELQTVNEELQIRTVELASTNNYMENLQSAIDLALIVVDRDMRVQRYTPPLTRLFQILQTDIGRPISTLKAALETNKLSEEILTVMTDVEQLTRQFEHEGTQWLMRINPYFDGHHDVNGAVLSFTDVTELTDARHDLALRTAALKAASDGLVLVNLEAENQPIIHASAAFYDLTGYSPSEVIGQNCRFLQGPETDMLALDAIRHAIKHRTSTNVELLNYRKDGSTFWNELRLSPVEDEDGIVRHYVGLQTDITARKSADLHTAHRANFDSLTGLCNRTLLLDRLTRALSSSERHGESTYVLFIDLDGFKEINDTLGHSLGDTLLVDAAHRLRNCVRENDTVARFGGDEFVVVLTDITGLDSAMVLAQSILTSLRKPFQLEKNAHRLSASIGIANYPEDATDAQTLIQHADTAMYRAKSNGRDGFAFFQTTMNTEAVTRSATKQAIFGALENNQFDLHYQPIIDVKTGRISSAEALLRWHHPTQGVMVPSDFVQIAEDTGQIIALGAWVIERAVRQLHNWRPFISENFRLAVNISARQLHDSALCELLEQLPDESVSRLDFEITESTFIDKRKSVTECLERIRAKGGRISLDDFGTGYSSLQFLLDFPIDTIKIDRTFIATDLSDDRNAAIVDSVFSIARGIGADVVAEGIETEDQLKFIKHRGCQRAQGFMFSKAINADAFEELFRSHNKATSQALPT